MSAPLTEAGLAAIEARRKRGETECAEGSDAMRALCEDVPALLAEVRRLGKVASEAEPILGEPCRWTYVATLNGWPVYLLCMRRGPHTEHLAALCGMCSDDARLPGWWREDAPPPRRA